MPGCPRRTLPRAGWPRSCHRRASGMRPGRLPRAVCRPRLPMPPQHRLHRLHPRRLPPPLPRAAGTPICGWLVEVCRAAPRLRMAPLAALPAPRLAARLAHPLRRGRPASPLPPTPAPPPTAPERWLPLPMRQPRPPRPRWHAARVPPRAAPSPGTWGRRGSRQTGSRPPGGRSRAAPDAARRSSGDGGPGVPSVRRGHRRRPRTDRPRRVRLGRSRVRSLAAMIPAAPGRRPDGRPVEGVPNVGR
jgi:hypothetical protein